MYAFEGLTFPLAWLPRRWLLAVGALAGRLAFRLWKKRRAIAVGNLEMIKANGSLPRDLDIQAVAGESFANMGRTMMESLILYHRGLTPFLNYCRMEEGEEYFKEAISKARESGKGVMLVTGHMGNWEVLCQFLSISYNCPMGIVGRTTGKPVVDAMMTKLRGRYGNTFISKRGGAREMMRVLKSGRTLGTLIDQAIVGNHPGAPIPFLGQIASTNLGPLRLARRSQAEVTMLLFWREGLNHYIKAFPGLEPSGLADSEEALVAEAGQLNEWLGEHIKKYPDQWMWGHRRWKSKEGLRQDPESII